MSDIVDLERRIAAALERIGHGVEALKSAAQDQARAEPAPPPAAAEGEAEALRAQLEDERMVNAQLTERVRVLNERLEGGTRELEETVAALRTQASASEKNLARLKAANAKLRENNEALRKANASGLAEPHLINKSMMEELEALRATRETDAAEVDAILTELKDVLEGGTHA